MAETNPMINLNIFDIIQEHNSKLKDIPVVFNSVDDQYKKLEAMCSTMGVYGDRAFQNIFSHNRVEDCLRALLKSSWKYVFNALNIKHIAPKTHLKEFERLLEDPPEFTEEAIKSVFKDYVTDARGMSLKAFAEIFCSLDPFYKSHSNIKVGVKGLPKRVIISGCGEWSHYGWDRVADVVNCVLRYRGKYDKCFNGEWDAKDYVSKNKGKDFEGLSFRLFQNGNCHIIFDKGAQDDINKALAEYYGEVLPDVYEHSNNKEDSKEVSKDLQFYRTPEKAVQWLMDEIYIRDSYKILEPSCGDGALLDGIKKKVTDDSLENVRVAAVEYDAGRCEQARKKGYSVVQANFLEMKSDKRFDLIVMNPPFYGKHYLKHIKKAYEHLANNGEIVSILPVTAKTNHGDIDKLYNCQWKDLPLGSFSESGTNINTVMVRISKPQPKGGNT